MDLGWGLKKIENERKEKRKRGGGGCKIRKT
jgi:hypothetical protein